MLAILAMGVSLISNYDKMKELEVSINRLELTAESNDDIAEVIYTDQIEPTPASVTDPVKEDTEDAVAGTPVVDNNTEDVTTEEVSEDVNDISTEQTLPAMTDGNPTYYTIKYGDSLGSIAYEFYGDVIYAKDIALANNMDVDDPIYEGEQLIIPSITP